MVSAFVKELASARIGATHNQYADSALRRHRLVEYLDSRRDARLLLVGEAAGYRGARVSGIAFTSERQLTGSGPTEISATIVHRTLEELGIAEDVVLWNLVPTHPHAPGLPFVRRLARRRCVLAVGRLAEEALEAPYVRHPAHGGAADFRATLARCI